jgi:hypothetical protein
VHILKFPHSMNCGAIEGAAEDYFFFTLFFGDIGAILAGVAGWFAARHRRRTAVSA